MRRGRHHSECDWRRNRSAEGLRRSQTAAGAARELYFYDCAASLLCFWGLNRIAITCRNRLLRCDRVCHFHKSLFNPNRRAKSGVALWKTIDRHIRCHRLHAFGRHYTSIPAPPELTVENILNSLRGGPLHLTSPPCSFADLANAIYLVLLAHPFRRRRKRSANCVSLNQTTNKHE